MADLKKQKVLCWSREKSVYLMWIAGINTM